MVECIHFRPELRYTHEALAAYLPKMENDTATPVAANLKGTRQGLSLVMKRCVFIQHCRDMTQALSPPNFSASPFCIWRNFSTLASRMSQ